jgi:Transposase DDE domain
VLGFGRCAPLSLSDQAIYKRLARRGIATMHWLLTEVSAWLAQRGAPAQQERLAPFASDVLALDERTLDQLGRWLSGLRALAKGDPPLLARRLSCMWDVRRHCFGRVDMHKDARPHCSVWAPQLLSGLRPGSLLLFDLGYFDFEWLDTLTRSGHFWISRLRRRTS